MDSINDILSSLSQDDIDVLKSMADSIFASPSSASDNSSDSPADTDFGSFLTPDMLIKLTTVMNMMNSRGSERCRLIEALKPNLSLPRRKKADEAMKFLKILEIIPLITDINKSGDSNDKPQL